MWKNIVCSECPWDHKPQLDKLLDLGATHPPRDGDYYFPIPGGNDPGPSGIKYEYFYDIWSNIHYGYVGNAVGIDWFTLQAGAAGASRTDRSDINAVSIGFDLWKGFGGFLQPVQLFRALLAGKAGLSRQPWFNGF